MRFLFWTRVMNSLGRLRVFLLEVADLITDVSDKLERPEQCAWLYALNWKESRDG